jgi:hypothetical protein
MKRLAAILFLLCAGWNAQAFDFTTNEINGTLDRSSYLSPQGSSPSYVFPYDLTLEDLLNTTHSNHLYVVGNGGENLEHIYEVKMEQVDIPLLASLNVPGYNFVQPTDNGGYGSNACIQWLTNIAHFPPLSWNGVAETNQMIPCTNITPMFLGCLPDNDAPPSSLAAQRNYASTNANAIYGTPIINTFDYLYTNGYFTNALATFDNGHPLQALTLVIDDYQLRAMGADTNVGSFTADWNAATVIGTTTNHCVVTSVSKSGNTLTVTMQWDRMGIYYDVPDDLSTNDARNAFLINSHLADTWQWPVKVANLPAGNYTVAIDGSDVCTLSSAQLAAGWNQTTNNAGPIWEQMKNVFKARLNQMGVNYTTRLSHSAGVNGTIAGVPDMANFGSATVTPYVTQGKRGTNYLAALAVSIAGIQQYDAAIFTAKQPTSHTYTFTGPPPPRFAPFHK